MSQFIVDNNGVGMHPTLTMRVDNFTQDDLDRGLTACTVVSDNKVGKGLPGDKLFGKVIAVSTEIGDDGVPVTCTVQARGVARFTFADPDQIPIVSQMVEVDGGGGVSQAYVRDGVLGGHYARGYVIARATSDRTVDVWLG